MLQRAFGRLKSLCGNNGLDAINARQFRNILKCINFIRIRHRSVDLFYLMSNETTKTLMAKIRNGSDDFQDFLERNCTARECSTALFMFLRTIKRGLFPERVQQLINGHNYKVPVRIIALDALGLLYEESRANKRNFIMISELLKLMKLLSTKGNLRPTEQHVTQAPYFVMPLLFDKKNSVALIQNFSQCMNILNEIILMSHILSLNYRAAYEKLRELEAAHSSFQLHESLNYQQGSSIVTLLKSRRALRPQFHLRS